MAVGSVGSTIRITVVFRVWDDNTDEGTPEDPATVEVNVLDNSVPPVAVITDVPINTAVGTYYYDWTPDEVGEFTVEFTGEFDDGSVDVVSQEFEIDTADTTIGVTLYQDYNITFAGILDPLYVNPDELVPLFPEATELDIAEALWIYSTEVKDLLELADDEVPGFTALEYIKASAACNLSKTFGDGLGDEYSIRLGDLSVTRQPRTASKIDRSTAATWCQLAGALRKELLFSKTGMAAVVKGAAYQNPIPERKLRDFDAGSQFAFETPDYQGTLDDVESTSDS